MSNKKLKWKYDEVLSHFESNDPRIASLMRSIGPLNFPLHGDHFHSLTSAIISQQVSTKAAASIKKKLIDGMGGELRPDIIASHTKEELRVFGISNQKAGYLLDLSNHFIQDKEKFSRLPKMTDEEVIKTLVEVKGIGVWTAQMFLMFTLGRTDVFAPLDLGLKNAMIKLYGWKSDPDKSKLEKTSLKWSPYRTIASMYLWRSL
jgi:DNA-3-methyladenine glycosylase II